MIGVLMGLNAIGVFGFLTRAHLDHMASIDLALADRTADIEARLAIQGRTVADLDRRIGQIDTAIEESTRLGRPLGAMTIADQKRRERAEITAQLQRRPRRSVASRSKRRRLIRSANRPRRRSDRCDISPRWSVYPPRILSERSGSLLWRLLPCLIRWRWRCCSLLAFARGANTPADPCPAWHRQARHRTKCLPDPRAAKRLQRAHSQAKDQTNPARSLLTPYAPSVLTLGGPSAAISLG
jgi:hypothetical protein